MGVSSIPQSPPQPATEAKAKSNSGNPLAFFGKLSKNYAVRAVFQALFTVWLVITAVFFLVRLMPSNPVEVYIQKLLEQGLSVEQARSEASILFSAEFDRPILEQYFSFIGNTLRGNLGKSISSTGTPVIDIIARFLPWTLFCIGSALLISFVLGIFLGMLIAYFRNTPFDFFVTTLASFFSSIPNFLIPFFLIYLLGLQLKWVSVGSIRGAYAPGVQPGFTPEFIGSVITHAFLPVFTYLLSTVGSWVLSMKNSTLGVLGEEYVNAAHARGLPQSRIITAYVGRNAALPLVTQLALRVGFVLSGAIFIENAFQYPGLGTQLYNGVLSRDYTLMMGVFLIITLATVFSNLLADMLYSRLDPRIRMTRG